MRIYALLAAAAATAMLAGCGLGQPDYPSFTEASYRLEGQTASVDGSGTAPTVIYRDGPKMRVETVLPGLGQATVVFDEATNAAYVLNPTGQAPAPTAPPPAATPTTPDADAAATPPVTAPGAAAPPTTQALGVAVRIDDAQAPQPLESAWAALSSDNARAVGRCEVAGEQGHEWAPKETAGGAERVACITSDGVVLRISENSAVLWQATSLQRGAQDAALFGVPPGYTLIDPQAVAEGVGENLERLDSVTGDALPSQNPPR